MRATIAAVAAAASLIAALLVSPSASAQSVEDFYRSRSVTMMVGFNVGNIYDTVTRTVARHIGKHIPGNPTVIPVNRPGAGSLAAGSAACAAGHSRRGAQREVDGARALGKPYSCLIANWP